MEPEHVRLIQNNRTKLIGNIQNPIDVVEKLFEKHLFTESMKQEVEAEKTQINQVRKILDTVPKRGPTSFSIFHESLIETANNTAADILKPEQDDADLPQDWPNEAAVTAAINVKQCKVNSVLVRDKWKSSDVYSMKKRCRGRCLIISNLVFHGPLERDKNGEYRVILPSRQGAQKDVEDLKKLFSQLHFYVITRFELTAQEIHDELLREAAHPDHKQAECFVCVICSHGTKEGIYGVDGKTISLENVTKYFDGRHCQALVSKPKLFFIQACQGETVDRPGGGNSTDGGQDLSSNLQTLRLSESYDQTDSDDPGSNTVPTELDILVACATHPGYVSLRHVHFGTWFIQAVVYVFQNFAMKEDVSSLLVLVNRLVARGRTALKEKEARDAMQASMQKTSLTKKLFLFPGVFADSEN